MYISLVKVLGPDMYWMTGMDDVSLAKTVVPTVYWVFDIPK